MCAVDNEIVLESVVYRWSFGHNWYIGSGKDAVNWWCDDCYLLELIVKCKKLLVVNCWDKDCDICDNDLCMN